MYTDRIGVHHKSPIASTQTDEAKMALRPAKEQSDSDTCHSAESGNHSPFEEKDADNETVISTQIA